LGFVARGVANDIIERKKKIHGKHHVTLRFTCI
jgi:hypothetical protein